MPPRLHRPVILLACLLALATGPAVAQVAEYRLKAAFLYNFAAFTEWPADTPTNLQVCIHGRDPFGEDVAQVQGKQVGGRTLSVRNTASFDGLKACQLVYVARGEIANMPRILEALRGRAVLTVADSPEALDQGVGINMETRHGKASFQVNLAAVRQGGLNLSSKLLRLATEVRQ